MNIRENYTADQAAVDAAEFATLWAQDAPTAKQHLIKWDTAYAYAMEDGHGHPEFPALCLLCSVGLCTHHGIITP